ncbi:uncharacterized protein LOC122048487 [Zingiber officinale]|uniref:DUF4408 domain-containing protein n=1 Tax=Zingiber officinale TaxID=94328 RepID=A0A8J5HI35_ZINOF|nr:uncharacterized protein LOC122048487 [Zingiber officinale]KAG6524997.1 hypothetical protein ZIOFF_014949 [Zingiber officinale]
MAEKIAARRRYRPIGRMYTLLRCIEALATLILLSWSSVRLPAALKLALDLSVRLLTLLRGHRFVFFLGNAIVLTLLALSGRHSTSSSCGSDVYDQFLACKNRAPPVVAEVLPEKTEEIISISPVDVEKKEKKTCRRTRSEKMESRLTKPDLRRSASAISGGEATAAEGYNEEADEFRRMVESFIATQQKRFHREESMAVFVSNEEQPQASLVPCS